MGHYSLYDCLLSQKSRGFNQNNHNKLDFKKMNLPLIDILKEEGYENIVDIEGNLYGIQRFIFTVGVCCNLHELGYGNRFCFDTFSNAALFLEGYDGVTHPVVGEDGCTSIKWVNLREISIYR